VTDQVSHPYKTTGKTSSVYFVPYVAWQTKGRQKTGPNGSRHCCTYVVACCTYVVACYTYVADTAALT
jgi:hypothetical protein